MVSVELQEVIAIDEIMSLFHAKFKINASWYDRRITFHNLMRSSRMNIISDVKMDEVWLPRFGFMNLNHPDPGTFDYTKTLIVIPNLDYVYEYGDTDNIYNERIFPGDNNSMMISTAFSSELYCDFAQHMFLFPFDTQFCSIDIVALGNLDQFADIELLPSSYSGSTSFSGFFFKDIKTCEERIGNGIAFR